MLTFGAGDFGVGYHLAVVVVDHDAVGVLDEAEVLGTLQDEADRVLQVEDMRGVPVGEVKDVALVGGGHDQVVVADGHVDDPILEVQVLVYLVEDVGDDDPVLVVEAGLPVAEAHFLIHNLGEHN